MRIYSDATTKRLEEKARHIGVDCQIRKIEAHEEGRYFVVALDDQPLKWPIALGFTDSQAEYSLKRRTWERFAVRGDATRLPSATSSRKKGHAAKRRPRLW